MTDPLAVRDLVAGYDAEAPVVRGVSVRVGASEIVTLLGPNGAGKSTLVKALAGLVPVFSGAAWLHGEAIAGRPAHVLARSGLGFVPQTDNVFVALSVRENLLVACREVSAARRRDRLAAVAELFPDLQKFAALRAGNLSGGQRQMLAIARALMPEPKFLMLDEPSAGLSPKLAGAVLDTLHRIRAAGVPILLVEQNTRAALRLADRAYVLVQGRVAHEGPAAALNADDLAHLYLQPAHAA